MTVRAFVRNYDHFDMAETVDFVSIESNVAVKAKAAELACDLDMLRSLKKTDIRTPDGEVGFWAMEQKAGQVNWEDVNSLVRPGLIRLFTFQLLSRGASGMLYFRWRQPRIGCEQFYGAILAHHLEGNRRTLTEISQIGEEIKLLAPGAQGHQSRRQRLHPLQPRKRMGLEPADAAE